MYNKKNDTLKIVGIVVGIVAGVATLAAGAYMLYKRYMAKKAECCCDECEIDDVCECHGKYACKCAHEEGCLFEEVELDTCNCENEEKCDSES
ncbi:MAG: hypothetical protein E7314_00305 [Clostridiales bacterium]|nr:hypothetical protein [Clostridiales bacterium]